MYYRGAQAAIIVYDITSQVLCTEMAGWNYLVDNIGCGVGLAVRWSQVQFPAIDFNVINLSLPSHLFTHSSDIKQ